MTPRSTTFCSKNYLQHQRDELALDGRQMAEMQALTPFANTIIGLEEARRKMQPVDPKKAAESLVEVTKAIESARKANPARAK